MRKKTLFTLFLLVLAVAVPAAYAQAEPYVIDVAHSILDFEIKSFFIDAQGTFKEFRGEVLFDQNSLEKSSIKFTIDVNSIDTRFQKRDDHLRGADFFDVARYPQIAFVSKKVIKTGPNTFDLVGDFSLHGVTKELKVPVQIIMVDKNRARFKAGISFKRSDFGITYNSKINPIDDLIKVALDINIMQP
jgi:polyisoprenoid-binding protein YceI